jgi:hypothetical protein
VSLEGTGCRATAAGELLSANGALWFQPRQQGAAEVRPVLLGGFSGVFSTLLPHKDNESAPPARLFAVRAAPVRQDQHTGDTLVHVDPDKLAVVPWWSADGRLRLLGRVGARAVVLQEDVGGARVAAVDPAAKDVLLSGPIEVPPAMWSGPRPEVAMPLAAPVGEGRFVLRCGGERLCLVRVGTRIEIQPLPVRAEGLLWSAGGLLLKQGRGRCAQVRGKPPERWGRLPARACPRDAAPAPGLMVEGALLRAAEVSVPACLVRDRIELPAQQGEPGQGGVGVVLLPAGGGSGGGAELSADLLLRGRALQVLFSADEGVPGPREFALALPPGAVSARPITVGADEAAGERALYQVRVRAAASLDPGGGCWRGRVSFQSSSGGDAASAGRAWRFGRCGDP